MDENSQLLQFLTKSHKTRCGVMVRSHADASDEALQEASRLVDMMLERVPSVVKRLCQAHAELHVIAPKHEISRLPYLTRFRELTQDGMSWDERNASGTCHGRWASASEANLLKTSDDLFACHRSIGVHEFAHTINQVGMCSALRRLFKQQYLESTARGKWATAYAATNHDEFFAELSMWYFGTRGDYGRIVFNDKRPETGRRWFEEYDPRAFALFDSFYQGRFEQRWPTPARIMCTAIHARKEFDVKSPKDDDEGGGEEEEGVKEEKGDERNKKDKKKRKEPEEDFEYDAEGSISPDNVGQRRKVELLVVNPLNENLKMYWLDSQGRRQDRGLVFASDTSLYYTYEGDPLLIADESTGQGVCVFIPTNQSPLQEAKIVNFNLSTTKD